MTSTYQYDLIGRMVGTDRSDGMKLRKVYDEKNRVKGYTYQKDRVGHEVEFLYGDVENSRNRGLDMESRSMAPRRLPMSMMPLDV